MHFPTLTLLLLPLAATVLSTPVDHQLRITIDTLDASTSGVDASLACGKVNGNCYENDCWGMFTDSRMECSQG
jgi:hypothetical protein